MRRASELFTKDSPIQAELRGGTPLSDRPFSRNGRNGLPAGTFHDRP